MLSFGIVLGVSMSLGIMYIALYFLQLVTNRALVRFIYDFLYVIIGSGIFGWGMYKVNVFDIKYFHVMALIIGVVLCGILPVHHIKAHESRIKSRLEDVKMRLQNTKFWQIIKK